MAIYRRTVALLPHTSVRNLITMEFKEYKLNVFAVTTVDILNFRVEFPHVYTDTEVVRSDSLRSFVEVWTCKCFRYQTLDFWSDTSST